MSQTVTITDDDDSLVRALSQGFQGPIIVSAAPSQWRAVAGRKDVPVPTTVGAPYSSVASTLEALGPRWWSRLVLAMPGGLPTSEDLKLLQTRLGEPPRAPGLQWMAMEAVDEMVRGLTRLGAGLSRERLIETMNSPGDRVSAGRRGGDDVTLVRIAADGRLQPLAPDEVSRIFLEQQQ